MVSVNSVGSTGILLRRRTRRFRISLIVLVLIFLVSILQALSNVYALVFMNFQGLSARSRLRGTAPTPSSQKQQSKSKSCPQLPDRLAEITEKQSPVNYLSTNEVDEQLKHMVPNRVGTTGNQVFLCDGGVSLPCRGVVKIYRWRHVYRHVKRCHKLLEGLGIVPRILFTDDDRKLMVEENLGRTISSSLLPPDFEVQLRRLLCILHNHKVIHRDLNWQNVVVDEQTGKVYLIDLGDAFVWGNLMLRNVINLFNIWWKGM
jgi:hypothetical protein